VTTSRATLHRSAAVVSAMTLVSRISGLAQSVFLAHVLGAGTAADAFFVAFRLPNLLRRFTAEGTMTAAFLPTLTEIEARDGDAAMRRTAARFLGTLVVLLFLFTIVAMVGMGLVVGVLVIGRLLPQAPWHEQLAALVAVLAGREPVPAEMALTTRLARVMFPYLVLVSLTAGLAALLNLRDRFALPASVSTFWNIAFIAVGTGLIAARGGMARLAPEDVALIAAIAVLAGGVVQLAILAPAVRREGFGVSLGLYLRDDDVRRTLRRMGPGLLAAGIYPLNALLSTMLASKLPAGAQTVLFNSSMMGEMVLGVFAMGLATASLPLLSRQASAGDLDGLRSSLAQALRSAALLALPAAVGMAVLAEPIVRLIFKTGRYGDEAVRWTAATLVFQCVGLLFAASQRIGTQALYALKDYRGPVAAALGAFVANIALSLALLDPLGTRGLALANGIASLFGLVWLAVLLNRRVGSAPARSVLASWMRMGTASAAMGAATWAASGALDLAGSHGRIVLVVRLFPLIGAAAFVYGAVLLALRDPDAGAFAASLRRLVDRRLRSRG
jgi:putative peptidoglycan lipid II flippase